MQVEVGKTDKAAGVSAGARSSEWCRKSVGLCRDFDWHAGWLSSPDNEARLIHLYRWILHWLRVWHSACIEPIEAMAEPVQQGARNLFAELERYLRDAESARSKRVSRGVQRMIYGNDFLGIHEGREY